MKPITEDEMQGYVEGYRRRRQLAETQRKDLQARALQVVSRCVERLRSIPEVRRVILYGSLAKGTFHRGSDIDLAVEGLPRETHFRVWAEVERDEEFSVDLHRWEELSEGLRQVIQGYGHVLHERR